MNPNTDSNNFRSRKPSGPLKFEAKLNLSKYVNQSHLSILKSTYEKFELIPNADFQIFLSKSLENTTSQTLFFFLLTQAKLNKHLNASSLNTFLKSQEVSKWFLSFQSEDYQVLN